MNIVILALSMCASICLQAAENPYNIATRKLAPLSKPLPAYPWDAITTARFVEHYNPACCANSLELPIIASIPCSFARCNFNFITRMQNNGCTVTSCCQGGCCFAGSTFAGVSCCLCSSTGPTSCVAGASIIALIIASAGSFGAVGYLSKCINDTDPGIYSIDRDYMRTAIEFYSMHARQAGERQSLLTTPSVPVMDEFRDIIDA